MFIPLSSHDFDLFWVHIRFQGDAAFWWNLKKSGEGDILTRHAGCPVLVGSKWGKTVLLYIVVMSIFCVFNCDEYGLINKSEENKISIALTYETMVTIVISQRRCNIRVPFL